MVSGNRNTTIWYARSVDTAVTGADTATDGPCGPATRTRVLSVATLSNGPPTLTGAATTSNGSRAVKVCPG